MFVSIFLGEISEKISELENLQYLNLSSNKFSGKDQNLIRFVLLML
jgi:hypothetical protein